MKKQVVTIHGGSTNDTYEEYIKELKAFKLDRDDITFNPTTRGWRHNLQSALGDGYEVFSPEMPSWMNSKYLEWKIWFEKLFPFLDDGPVFIGHSLGGIFLAKYFAENADMKKTSGVFLVAAPYCAKSKFGMADFVLPDDLGRLEKLGDKLHLYHSEDDPIVHFSDLKKYQKLLPGALITVFKDREHFRQPEFPEIVRDILEAFK